ncbi:MAG: FkbM family methyltransferase [Gemmataceae bacterium]
MGARFEPHLVRLLGELCEPHYQILDVGANLGLTALLFSQLAPAGRVAAIEPVPASYELLARNLAYNRCTNVSAFPFAASACTATLRMECPAWFLAGAHVLPEVEDFPNTATVEVPARRLDDEFAQLGLQGLDLIKIDTEGYELEVLAGAAQLIEKYRPTVLLEMNHYCLNILRRLSLPEFRERICAIFPSVHAVDRDGVFVDFADPAGWRQVQHAHVVHGRFGNLVAGFDRARIMRSLARAGEMLIRPGVGRKVAGYVRSLSRNYLLPVRWLRQQWCSRSAISHGKPHEQARIT